MHTYLSVVPGIDMTRALGDMRLTKKWLRDYLRDHPEKDFRCLDTSRGTYVNGGDATAIGMDLTLRVMRGATTVAMVNYQRTETNEWGYQAVVS